MPTWGLVVAVARGDGADGDRENQNDRGEIGARRRSAALHGDNPCAGPSASDLAIEAALVPAVC
jgi:hypothetical protein